MILTPPPPTTEPTTGFLGPPDTPGKPPPGLFSPPDPQQMTPPDFYDMAYGGSGGGQQTLMAQAGQIRRLERTVPRTRRGRLVVTVPRTKGETLYIRDNGQTLQNQVLNTGSTGVGGSGIPLPGTTNQPATSGAISRYRYQNKTNLQ